MKITEDFIIWFTGNASTVSNGRKLAANGSYINLARSQDGSLIFGSCSGSGKSTYQCSVDFSEEANPIPRCSCPSRQIPCKHAVGLLFCDLNGAGFATQDIPDDISAKRAKIQTRKEKNNTPKDDKPKELTKAKVTAAIKKCRAQLEGISLAEKILHNIVLSGLHSINAQNKNLLNQQIKELGNYYIFGVQAEFTELLAAAQTGQKDQDFANAVEHINKCYALLRKGRSYLEALIADYEAFPEITKTAEADMLHSAIEEQLGYAWKLMELKEKGLYQTDDELLQVAFRCYEETGKRQWVDEGIWISLKTGVIYKTCNYRPFRAKNYIREEDSCFEVLTVPELYIYPGDKNPRVRWDQAVSRECMPEDYRRILKFGEHDFSAVIKQVKAQIKSPLNDRQPIYLLRPEKFEQTARGQLFIRDDKEVSIPLKLNQFSGLLTRLAKSQVVDGVLLCRFEMNLEDEMLYGVVLAAINANELIRFSY